MWVVYGRVILSAYLCFADLNVYMQLNVVFYVSLSDDVMNVFAGRG
jgi:hypothetical protein